MITLIENEWLDAISENVESIIAQDRAVLVICEDIATAEIIQHKISTQYREDSNVAIYLRTENDEGNLNKELKSRDVIITTNLGARGTELCN